MTKTLEARKTVNTSISDVILSAISSAKECQELRGASITFSPKGSLFATIVPQTVHTAVVNLILNAAESRPHATILVELNTPPDKPCLVIGVHDNGPGIPAPLHACIFEPHFSTKPFNPGMGLVAVLAAAQVHGGAVEVSTSKKLGGACVTLSIALVPESPK